MASSNGNRSNDNLRTEIRRINIGVFVLLVAMVFGPIYVGWVVAQRYPSINTVSIENMRTRGNTALCPGEALTMRYTLTAEGSGVLVRDETVWSVDPPRTVIYSSNKRFILEGPYEESLSDAWHVPQRHTSPYTNKIEPLPPGNYRRILAISSPAEPRIVAIEGVDFSIRESCGE